MRYGTTFSLMEGKAEGLPVVAMIREGLQDYEAKSDVPWFLGLSTRVSDPTPQGLPTAAEANDLNQWEDAVDREIRSRCESVFIGRVTWKGSRELLYYIDEPEKVTPVIRHLASDRTLRPFAFRYERDPDWANVRVYIHRVS